MCRKAAAAELTTEVTSALHIQRRMHGLNIIIEADLYQLFSFVKNYFRYKLTIQTQKGIINVIIRLFEGMCI